MIIRFAFDLAISLFDVAKFACWSQVSQLFNGFFTFNQVSVERQDIEHETPTEGLHSDDLSVLDVAVLINLTRTHEHSVSFECLVEVGFSLCG